MSTGASYHRAKIFRCQFLGPPVESFSRWGQTDTLPVGTQTTIVTSTPWNTTEENTMALIQRLITDESGATAIEYGLIAGLVAVAIIAALTALGTSLDTLFSNVATTVSGAAS